MTSPISKLLRRTLRTNQILERLERIERSICSDQVLERLDSVERTMGGDQILGRLERVERSLGGEQILERLGRIERSLRTDEVLERLEHVERAQSDRSSAQAQAVATASRETLLGLHLHRLREVVGRLDLVTDFPVALDSPDHQIPWGTARDNSTNPRFNARLLSLLPVERMSLLDLGCSGGGQVRSFIEQGLVAVGIEGSDYSCLRLRAEWLTIPEFLFTGDITRPFQVQRSNGEVFRFGVVTLWEVIEHIKETDLPMLFRNIEAHLLPGGLVIMSVSPNSDIINGIELHQTIQSREWWVEKLGMLGWDDHPRIIEHFQGDFVRDQSNAPNSFHLALSRRGAQPVLAPRYRSLVGARVGS